MKTDEITAVGAIYAFFIMIGLYLYLNHTQTQTTLKLQSKLLETQHLAIQLHKETQMLESTVFTLDNEISKLTEDLSYYQSLVNVKETLKDYPLEEVAMGLALAWTESSWRYNVDHNSSAEGICGVIPKFWESYLNEQAIELNSVEACIAIYKYYLDQTGSPSRAIKEYKGIESSKYQYLVSKTLGIRDLILSNLKGN